MTPLEQLRDVVGDRLRVDADLHVDVDGQPLRLTGAGRQLRLHVQDAAALRVAGEARAGSRPGRLTRLAGDLTRLAADLETLGLTVTVTSPSGRLATVGAGAAGGLSARALRAPIRPHRAASDLVTSSTRRAATGAALLAVLAAGAAVVRRLRRRGG